MTCCARRSTFAPAESEMTSKYSGYSRQMSSVCVPIEPVEPSSATTFSAICRERGQAVTQVSAPRTGAAGLMQRASCARVKGGRGAEQ